MKKIVVLLLIIHSFLLKAQTDFSGKWEDHFSYNNAKKIIKVDTLIYVLVDNAIFIYDENKKTIEKISSINGLSGDTTTAMYYDKDEDLLIVGYDTGLIQIINKQKKVINSPEILYFNHTGSKQINDIKKYNNTVYIATDFGIVEYYLGKFEFGDTFFLSKGALIQEIEQLTFYNNQIYAISSGGVYTADIDNPNLVDSQNWVLKYSDYFSNITTFNAQLYLAKNEQLFEVNDGTLVAKRRFNSKIKSLQSTENSLSVALENSVMILDTNNQVKYTISSNTKYPFKANTAFEEKGILYIATKRYGVLKSEASNFNNVQEIHPDGPLDNDIFSVASYDGHVWAVYGGFTDTFAFFGDPIGYSHLYNDVWMNVRNSPEINMPNFVDVTIDSKNANHVFINSFGGSSNPNTIKTGGVLEIQDDKVVAFYNHVNSDLEDILPNNPDYFTIRISSSVFDNSGNLWMTNVGTDNRLKRLSPDGNWTSYNVNSLIGKQFGLYDMAVDASNTIWVSTRKLGVFAFNEKGNRKRVLTTQANRGNLPNGKSRAVAIDTDNKVWIGTDTGLVVYDNALDIFEKNTYNAKPIIIEENGIGRKLMGNRTITSIEIDGANNKWLGTSGSGVVYTNPNGQKTLNIFNKDNSPLPSNRIQKISVDKMTGKVYFATDKGLVAYNSNVAPFGENLPDVYAYPNPVLNKHQKVTIDGRNGKHLPKGTNVKILDTSGYLVYETNVVEGQQLEGGKVVWNKRNLAGQKVASGIYIVLLSTEDGQQSKSLKIAIVN